MKIYSSRTVANEIIRLAENEGRRLTPAELNCFVYFAAMEAVVCSRGQSMLINEAFEADKIGPVCRGLVNEFGLSDEPIDSFSSNGGNVPSEDYEAKAVISKAWNDYRIFSNSELRKEATAVGTPWDRARSFGEGSQINSSDILDYYFLQDRVVKSPKAEVVSREMISFCA